MKNLNLDSSRWKLINNLLVVCLSLYGFAMQNYTVGEASLFQKFVIEMIAPIQRGAVSIRENISSTVDHYVQIVNTSKENVELKQKLVEFENEIFKLGEVQKENERLKQLLEFGREIVSWDASNEFKVLRINKGENDGLKILSPVITMTGLVGYVYRLSGDYADILTILDQNNRVDAIVSRTRTHGIVEGHTGFNCRLKYVSRTEKLEIGDEIITAGFGEIYPKGIKVGKILQIDKESYGITQKIEVAPSVDFHKLEEVVVLVESDEQEVADKKSEQREEKI